MSCSTGNRKCLEATLLHAGKLVSMAFRRRDQNRGAGPCRLPFRKTNSSGTRPATDGDLAGIAGLEILGLGFSFGAEMEPAFVLIPQRCSRRGKEFEGHSAGYQRQDGKG